MIQASTPHLSLLNVGIAHHQSDWNWHNVHSPFARIYYIVEGHAQVLLPDKKLDLTPGRLYLIPPFTTHHYVCKERFTHYYVHLYEQKELSQQGIFDDWDIPNETEGHQGDLTMMEHLCRLLPHLRLPSSDPESYDNRARLGDRLKEESQRQLYEQMEVQGILLILLSRFLRSARQRMLSQDIRIQHALMYIHSHLEQKIALDTLAAETCMSKDHFIRIFKQTTGVTPANYITRRKLERAEVLLTTTEIPVKNIATELGYDDISYFVRVFHKHSNMTPQEYRNMRQ